jgi:tRNA-2-methylthio-N6-dimethylallyladenosine synthase
MDGQVPEPVKDERLQRLQTLLADEGRRFNASKIGQSTRILIDRVGRRQGQMIGKSPWLQSVFVETDAKIGDMVDVTLTAALPNSLAGELVTKVSQQAA